MTARPQGQADTDRWIAIAKTVHVGEIITRRGIRLRGRRPNCSGPCPRCGGRDRFGVQTGKELFHCRGCGAKGHGAVDLVMFLDGVDFLAAVETLAGPPPQAVRASTPPVADPDRERRESERAAKYAAERERAEAEAAAERARQIAKAQWLWSRRQPITEDCAAGLYLRCRGYRGIIPATLGFLPPHGPHPPAMIACFGLASEIEPGIIAAPANVTAVHLTKLTQAGRKAELDPNELVKIIIGQSMGAPIVLAPMDDLLGLAVVEGIENGLSVLQTRGLGVWVAGAAGRLLPLAPLVPRYADCITIFGDNDSAGRNGATGLAEALTARGFTGDGQLLLEGFDP